MNDEKPLYRNMKKFLGLFAEETQSITESTKEICGNLCESEGMRILLRVFSSIPDDIRETELYREVSELEKKEIEYEDVTNFQNELGYQTYEASVAIMRRKESKTILDEYILSIIESEHIGVKEKAIVILAHFEELLYQALKHERKKHDKVKSIILNENKEMTGLNKRNLQLLFIVGIGFVTFSNTDNYHGKIDPRIPFRNNILHRGMLEYSTKDAEELYELLVFFTSKLSTDLCS